MSLEPETLAPPVLAAGVAAMSYIDTDNANDAHSRLSLLLLEDDEALRQMLVWELSELGYSVIAVGSCCEARAAVAARDFNLALFDVGLPDGDGAELAAEMIELKPELRIVLCSGKSGNSTTERLPSEIVACLTKPVSIRRLDILFRDSA